MSGHGINTEMTGDQHPLMLCKVHPEAARDIESLRHYGVKSSVVIPLVKINFQ